MCANRLVHGSSTNSLVWWDSLPLFTKEDFYMNKYNVPCYKFEWSYMNFDFCPHDFNYYFGFNIVECVVFDVEG